MSELEKVTMPTVAIVTSKPMTPDQFNTNMHLVIGKSVYRWTAPGFAIALIDLVLRQHGYAAGMDRLLKIIETDAPAASNLDDSATL